MRMSLNRPIIGAVAMFFIVIGGFASSASATSSTTLTLSTHTLLPDHAVVFHATGFEKSEAVQVRWLRASGPVLGTYHANASGKVVGNFVTPLPGAGATPTASVYVLGEKSHRIAHETVTLTCTDEWTDLSGGAWNTNKDWSSGHAPTATTHACITLAGTHNYVVTVSAAAASPTVKTLDVGTTATTRQTLELDANTSSTFTISSTAEILTSGKLILTDSGSGGTTTLAGGSLTNQGTLETEHGSGASRYVNVTLLNAATGTFLVDGPAYTDGDSPTAAPTATAASTFQDAPFTNEGHWDIAGGSSDLIVDQKVTQRGGTVSNAGLTELTGGSTVNESGGSGSGNPLSLFGGTIGDTGGTVSLDTYDDEQFSGNVPAGQTVTVTGNGSDVHLYLAANTTNDGTLTMTAANVNGDGGSNAWLVPSSGLVTLTNNGTLDAAEGIGWSRYLQVVLNNTASGTVDVNETNLYPQDALSTAGTVDVTALALLQTQNTSVDLTGGSIANSGTVQFSNVTLTDSGGAGTGAALNVNGGSLDDTGGTAALDIISDTTLTGSIPTGQTITVIGNGSSDIHLVLAGNTTNDGTLNLTSASINSDGGGNAWVTSSATATLTNDGTIDTLSGIGWSRYFTVSVTNASTGTFQVGDTATFSYASLSPTSGGATYFSPVQSLGSVTLNNDGTVDLLAGAPLLFNGDVYGQADFTQSSGTLDVNIDGSNSSILVQTGCSASGCQNESEQLGGTLSVAAQSDPGTEIYPIAANEFDGGGSALSGSFATVDAPGYTVTDNEGIGVDSANGDLATVSVIKNS